MPAPGEIYFGPFEESPFGIDSGKAPGWLTLRLQKVIPGYIEVVRDAPITLADKVVCYSAIAYRLIAPQTWIKQFLPGRYTET